MSKLKNSLRDLVYTQNIKNVSDLTPETILALAADYMDDIPLSDQLDIVIEPNAEKVVASVKAALRGEGVGAYGLMNPRALLAHDILLGAALWAKDEIEDALDEVLSEVYNDDKGLC